MVPGAADHADHADRWFPGPRTTRITPTDGSRGRGPRGSRRPMVPGAADHADHADRWFPGPRTTRITPTDGFPGPRTTRITPTDGSRGRGPRGSRRPMVPGAADHADHADRSFTGPRNTRITPNDCSRRATVLCAPSLGRRSRSFWLSLLRRCEIRCLRFTSRGTSVRVASNLTVPHSPRLQRLL